MDILSAPERVGLAAVPFRQERTPPSGATSRCLSTRACATRSSRAACQYSGGQSSSESPDIYANETSGRALDAASRHELPSMEGHAFHSAAVAQEASASGSSGTMAPLQSDQPKRTVLGPTMTSMSRIYLRATSRGRGTRWPEMPQLDWKIIDHHDI
jgi:hypothetical protein